MAERVYRGYSGMHEGWYVYLDGEKVHFSKEDYECDMFAAELKARIKVLELEKVAKNCADTESRVPMGVIQESLKPVWLKDMEFENGLTIRELKEIIRGLPETDKNGEPYEVWMQTGTGYSSPVTEVSPLNQRDDGQDLYFGNGYAFKKRTE